jgi:hypothetical protein
MHVDAMHSLMLLFRFATDHRLTLTVDGAGSGQAIRGQEAESGRRVRADCSSLAHAPIGPASDQAATHVYATHVRVFACD